MKHILQNFLKTFSLVFLMAAFSSPLQAQFFKNMNLFSIEDDIKLGRQVKDEIAKNSAQYPVLDAQKYPLAYQELTKIRDHILNSGIIKHKDDFDWELKIIHDDSTLNAFVTPGGYIYVYTGLIKYLDNTDQLAGVMGHEVAHADQRHSTRNMTKQYGVSAVLGMLLGNSSKLAEMAGAISGNLAGLKFSRDMEQEADAYSVKYLARTPYQCNGAAGFFEKILNQGSGQEPPQFLSTHPSSKSRVEDINQMADELACDKGLSGINYQRLKNSLP